jgi:ribosome-associated toxin RatA of RatAB toxin-antitoxin module
MVLLLITAYTLLPARISSQEAWTLQKDTEQIDVYYRSTEKYLYEIRVEAKFGTNKNHIIAAIKDIESYPEWIYRCTEARWLKKTEKERIIYTVTDVPWPFSDRDVITKVEGPYYIKDNTAILKSRALSDYLPKTENLVRQEHSNVKWVITPVSENSTHITYTLSLRIEKDIPDFIMSMITTKGPYESFKNLLELVEG